MFVRPIYIICMGLRLLAGHFKLDTNPKFLAFPVRLFVVVRNVEHVLRLKAIGNLVVLADKRGVGDRTVDMLRVDAVGIDGIRSLVGLDAGGVGRGNEKDEEIAVGLDYFPNGQLDKAGLAAMGVPIVLLNLLPKAYERVVACLGKQVRSHKQGGAQRKKSVSFHNVLKSAISRQAKASKLSLVLWLNEIVGFNDK